jgi:predicted methyltransferase
MSISSKEIQMREFAMTAACAALALAAIAARGQAYTVPEDTPAHIRAAVQSSERTDEMRARDLNRLPAEIMTMAGIEPGDHVIEFAAFGHYYTTMLVAAVGSQGRVDMYDLPYTDRFGGEGARAFAVAHPNAFYHQAHYNEVDYPSNVDSVFNVLYYHDLAPNEIDTADLNAKIFEALVPGGTYVIVDHKAEDGSGWRDAATIHRMGADTIVEEVTAAGFELAVDSDILAHPEDDRTQMVFSPGVRGGTDRAVFVFRKPD